MGRSILVMLSLLLLSAGCGRKSSTTPATLSTEKLPPEVSGSPVEALRLHPSAGK